MAKMKVILAFISLVISHNWQQIQATESEESAEMAEQCADEVGIGREMIKRLEEDPTLFSEENNRCYLKCLFDKHEIIDHYGNINGGMYNEVFHNANHLEALPKCEQKYNMEDNICDKVYLIYQCISTVRVHFKV